MAQTEGLVERVFPLRIEVDENRGRQNTGAGIEKVACHGAKRTKFDGPKIWGHKHAKFSDIDAQEERPQFTELIQGFGALIALRKTADSFDTIAVSQNTPDITTLSLDDLFGHGHGGFSRLLHPDSRADFDSRLATIANAAAKTGTEILLIEPELFSVSITLLSGEPALFWCTLYATIGDPNVFVCELEQYIPFLQLPRPTTTIKPRIPSKRLNHIPTQEEYSRATTSKSSPLRYHLSQNTASHHQTVDPLNLMNQIQRQYSTPSSIPQLYDAIVGTVRDLTKFDRVMVYRFDECKCGAVVGELLNPEASEDVFLGLHFPSSDVPAPVRELYKLDRVQVLRHKSQPVSEIVDREGIKMVLDLSRSYLRAFSPEQVEYFSRMNVTSAMSISLIVDDELWGLIMCHSYDSETTIISPPLKELCKAIGGCASTHVERLLSKEKAELRGTLMAGLSLKSPVAFLTADTANLLQVFGADFGLLTLNSEARAIGRLEAYQEALALLQYFRARKPTKVFSSQKIATDFPDLNYERGFKILAGVLVIPLSDSGADFLTLFRKGQLLEVHWAGNEQEQFQYVGSDVPEPTASLLRWVEHVIDTSREWTDDQMDIATVIGLLYGTFIKTWQQKEAMDESGRVRRLLISNASHEVRTPLNSIINYLEIILDGEVDEITREQLGNSLTASKSLIFAINDLLDLTRVTGNGPILMTETFDFRNELNGVIDVFREEANRKGLSLLTELNSDKLPTLVKGDPMRLRQSVSNILSNALEHTTEGRIIVKVDVKSKDSHVVIEVTVQDEGHGMSEAQLDSLFQHLEHIVEEFSPEASSEKSQRTVGLGLAVVARFVRNCQGQLKIRSQLGVGTAVHLRMSLSSAIDSRPEKPTLETAPSDQVMADLLQNIEERIDMISKGLGQGNETDSKNIEEPMDMKSKDLVQMIRTDSKNISTPVTEMASVGSLPTTSPTPSLTSQTSFIGSSQHSPTLERRGSRGFPFPYMSDSKIGTAKLGILVAEDNPLNSKILNLRLGKMGHHVTLTSNGQACADTFMARSDEFDVILMDIQMPLLDGHSSTKLIRAFEAEKSPKLSEDAARLGRIPIFAVSASLLEDLREEYVATGFDGWIMKPIDFKRLNLLMKGISETDTREACMYKLGEFEYGGWFRNA